MQTICTCEPGMGEARLAYAVRNGFSVETYEGQRAAVSADGRQLQAWAGDRCEVSIWADSKRRLRAIANETDWSGLEALCSARTLAAAL